MLDAHHRSASGGTSKSAMTRAKEVLGAKEVSKLDSPSMLLPIVASRASNRARVQEIANHIEMMRFRQFVKELQIFVEKYGEPVHPKYVGEAALIREFAKLNPLLSPPGDLTRWVIRFVLDKTNMILKNMTLELIVMKLRETYPDAFIVYTPENASTIIVRVYTRASYFKGNITLSIARAYKEDLLDTIIRGVDGITNANVVKMVRNKVNDDGSISRDDNIYGISTIGTSLRGILTCNYIDHERVQTDAIQETYAMFGIEAARQKVISELRELVGSCNPRHYQIYADEMCYTGRVTSIESSGLKIREASALLLRIGFSSPLMTMEEAAMNSMEDSVTGITAPLLLGTVGRTGSLYNSVHVDGEFVAKNATRGDDFAEGLFA
jgi:DNA-directed RNA polymerase II subunit RPB1